VSNALRYLSQMTIPEIGHSGQQKIGTAKVLVIGAGGLGCPVLSYLTGLGTGTIGIVDNDVVEIQNLHRQVLYTEADIGQLKAATAAKKLKALNSNITINIYAERLTKENALQIIGAYDLVIDCCDNAQTRYLVNDTTRSLNKPFVYGAVRHWEGQLSVFNYKNGPSYRHLFSSETASAEEENCASAGISGHVTGVVGSLQVNEALKIILGDDNVLSGQVLIINLYNLEFKKLTIKKY
jgi:sulfur-carrier protein adenylyltransferase/sulfurtransferase